MCVKYESSMFGAFSGWAPAGFDIVSRYWLAGPMPADWKKASPISKSVRNVEVNLIFQMAFETKFQRQWTQILIA